MDKSVHERSILLSPSFKVTDAECLLHFNHPNLTYSPALINRYIFSFRGRNHSSFELQNILLIRCIWLYSVLFCSVMVCVWVIQMADPWNRQHICHWFYPMLTKPGAEQREICQGGFAPSQLVLLYALYFHLCTWGRIAQNSAQRPLASAEEQNRERNHRFCRTHKHPECRSHSLPDVLCVSCSNKAAATSSQTPGKQHSPQKSSDLETHFHWQFGEVGHSLKKKP